MAATDSSSLILVLLILLYLNLSVSLFNFLPNIILQEKNPP